MGYDDDQTDRSEEINLLESQETKISQETKEETKKEAAVKLQEYLAVNDQRINQLESQIEQIPNVIAATIEQALGNKPQAENPAQSVNDMPPELKAQMLSQLVQSLSQAYAAVKGNPAQGAGVDFQSMMAEWGMRMFNYHLDNMAQSVYQIKLPPPDNLRLRNVPQGVAEQSHMQQGQPQQPQQQAQNRGHRFA